MAPSSAHEGLADAADKAVDSACALLGLSVKALRGTRWRRPEDPPNIGMEADACFYVGTSAEGFGLRPSAMVVKRLRRRLGHGRRPVSLLELNGRRSTVARWLITPHSGPGRCGGSSVRAAAWLSTSLICTQAAGHHHRRRDPRFSWGWKVHKSGAC